MDKYPNHETTHTLIIFKPRTRQRFKTRERHLNLESLQKILCTSCIVADAIYRNTVEERDGLVDAKKLLIIGAHLCIASPFFANIWFVL